MIDRHLQAEIEPFLKVLVSRKLGLRQHLPPGPERELILDALIRDKLSDPDSIPRDMPAEAILSTLRNHMSA